MNATRIALAQQAASYGKSFNPNPAQWLLDNGRDFQHAALPKGIRMKKPQQCYWNSVNFVRKNLDRYVYVEGWATGQVTSTAHAWCYDRETKLIIDLTWKEGSDYVGVPFRYRYAVEQIVLGPMGWVIDNYMDKYRLIRGEVSRDEWEEHL